MPIAGGPAQRLTDEISGAPAISPDGKSIAFSYRATALGPITLAVRSLDDLRPPVLLDIQDAPARSLYRWTSDGRSVAYVPTRDAANVWQQPLDGRPPQRVTAFLSESVANFAFSSDGRQLAVSRGTTRTDVVLVVPTQ